MLSNALRRQLRKKKGVLYAMFQTCPWPIGVARAVQCMMLAYHLLPVSSRVLSALICSAPNCLSSEHHSSELYIGTPAHGSVSFPVCSSAKGSTIYLAFTRLFLGGPNYPLLGPDWLSLWLPPRCAP